MYHSNQTVISWDTVICLDPRPPKRGCCDPLRLKKKLTAFLPNKLRQMLPDNHFYILYASFDVYGVILGGVVWVWGVIKENGRGGVGEIPWFLFCPFLKYLTRYVLQICYVDENHHFLTYSPKILRRSHVSTIFSEKLIFANFHIYFQCTQISEGALTLWRHSDVIWSSMVLILVSIDRGGSYL